MDANLAGSLSKSVGDDRLQVLRRVAARAAGMRMPAYLVGGVVRDALLGRPIRDLDMVLEGNAPRLGRALAKDFGGKVLVHSQFRTATWTLPPGDAGLNRLDLITARTETYASPGALPDVRPGSIRDDLGRRDFTVNAMAVRLDGERYGELLDPLGGQGDLERKTIRVLHPRSFLEDPTRLLRAARYAERYGFEIDPATLGLITDEARSVLAELSGERLRHEFDLIFEEPAPVPVLSRLASLDLLAPIHPALSSAEPRLPNPAEAKPDLFENAPEAALPAAQVVGWCCWLMDRTSAEIRSIAKRLAFPAALTAAVGSAAGLAARLPELAGARPSRWTEALDGLPASSIWAVHSRQGEPALKEYLENWRAVRARTSGEALKARGLPPGPRYGEILKRLRAGWLDGELTSAADESALLERLLHEKGA